MEDRIIEEISYLTERIDKIDGNPTDIHALLSPSMSNNICHLVFGHRFQTDDPKRMLLDKTLDEASQRFSQIGVLAMSPTWFSKTILRIGAYGNKNLIQTVFNIFK